MILDKDLLCSDDQTLAFNIGSAASTNVIDLAKAGLGRGEPIKAFCQITADFDSAGVGIVENLRSAAPDLSLWRYGAADYAAAGGRLAHVDGAGNGGTPAAAQVDHEVALRREHLTNAVHEESILDLLLADLAAEPTNR